MINENNISVITDEIGDTIEEQIHAIRNSNIKHIELRKVNKKYLHEISEKELKAIKEKIKENNLKVVTIDTPIGKKEMFYTDKQLLINQYFKIAKIFKCKYIRIFSNIGKTKTFKSISEELKNISQLARENKIEILVENEKNTMFESPIQSLSIINKFDNIYSLFDIENAFSLNKDIFKIYKLAKNKIVYIHLRDIKLDKKKFEYLGKGDIRLKEFIKLLQDNNYNGFLSLETHLPMNNTNESKEEMYLKSMKCMLDLIK